MQFGSTGTQGGQFQGVKALALGPGGLYTIEAWRVQQFDLEGNFQRAWGRGVAGGQDAEICTVAASCACGFAGTGEGEFAASCLSFDSLSGIATAPNGDVVTVEDSGGNRIQRFSSTG